MIAWDDKQWLISGCLLCSLFLCDMSVYKIFSFSHASSMALGMVTELCDPDRNIWTTIQMIPIKFCTDVHGPLMMNCIFLGDLSEMFWSYLTIHYALLMEVYWPFVSWPIFLYCLCFNDPLILQKKVLNIFVAFIFKVKESSCLCKLVVMWCIMVQSSH